MELAYTASPHVSGDYYKIGKGIYAVADGVTRIGKKNGSYFNSFNYLVQVPAKIFCEEVVSFLNLGKKINKNMLLKAFETANYKILLENKKHGFTPKSINYLDKDYLTTTAALVAIKENTLYAARICDCDISIIRNGRIFFQTRDYWDTLSNPSHVKEPIPQNPVLQRKWMHQNLRNKKIKGGYGVLTGEKQALSFVEFFTKKIKKGDIVIISTDGFRPYFDLQEFLNILFNWKNNKETIKRLEQLFMNKRKTGEKFDHERTFIAIKK